MVGFGELSDRVWECGLRLYLAPHNAASTLRYARSECCPEQEGGSINHRDRFDKNRFARVKNERLPVQGGFETRGSHVETWHSTHCHLQNVQTVSSYKKPH